MNNQNLVSLAERDPEEVARIASAGGRAAAAARREKRKLKDELMTILEHGDTQERLCTALIERGLKGDPRAFSTIRDTIGEKPVEQTEILASSPLDGTLEERRQRVIEQLRKLRNEESA